MPASLAPATLNLNLREDFHAWHFEVFAQLCYLLYLLDPGVAIPQFDHLDPGVVVEHYLNY